MSRTLTVTEEQFLLIQLALECYRSSIMWMAQNWQTTQQEREVIEAEKGEILALEELLKGEPTSFVLQGKLVRREDVEDDDE